MIWLVHGRNFFVTLDDLLTLRVPPPANDPTMMNAMARRVAAIRFVKLDDLAIPMRAASAGATGAPAEDTPRD